MLDTTTAAVKSMLQRARARLDEVSPGEAAEPTEPERRWLLDQYVAAFENADLAALERALTHDAALEAVPSSTWFSGKKTCVAYLASVVGRPGDWRMVRIVANGQPAAVAYLRGEPFGIGVLTVTSVGISRITAFGDPGLVTRFLSVHSGSGVVGENLV